MARFTSSDTAPELVLRRALRSAGLTGYRLHSRELPGKPDLAYTRWKVAVFVDGAFWHGHPSVFQFGTKGEYWDSKIRRNQERDRVVTAQLQSEGWCVLRLWDLDVVRDPEAAADSIAEALAARGRRTA
jgi:DNA mismatch endonuclease (patch repair protein)